MGIGIREGHKQKIQDAEETPFDDTNVEITADDVQTAIEELDDQVAIAASPGYSFGAPGNVTVNVWLQRPGSVPSNKTGITIGIVDPVLTRVTVASQNVDTYDVGIYQHDGNSINLTLMATVNVVAARQQTFNLDVALTYNKQLAVRLTSGSAKNVGVDLQLAGTAP